MIVSAGNDIWGNGAVDFYGNHSQVPDSAFHGLGEGWGQYLGNCIQDAGNLCLGVADDLLRFISGGIGTAAKSSAVLGASASAGYMAVDVSPAPSVSKSAEVAGTSTLSKDVRDMARMALPPNFAGIHAEEGDLGGLVAPSTPLEGVIVARALQSSDYSRVLA